MRVSINRSRVLISIEKADTVSCISVLFFCYSLQVQNEEHAPGGHAGAEPGASPAGGSAGGQPTWVNSLVGRIFWDFLREKYWTDQVAHKIQKKLSKIKVRKDEDSNFIFQGN